MDVLDQYDLKGVDILDLLCLNSDLQPLEGCDGPSLATDDLTAVISLRLQHVLRAAIKHGQEKNKLVNNARRYFSSDEIKNRWEIWLSRSGQGTTRSWLCCPQIVSSHDHPAVEDDSLQLSSVPHSPTNRPLSVASNNSVRDDTFRQDQMDRGSGPPRPDISPLAPRVDDGLSSWITCDCGQGFQTIRQFIRHVDSICRCRVSARKSVPSKACAYGCGYTSNNYTSHEKATHYQCAQGIHTRSGAIHECDLVKTDPVTFFSLPKAPLPPEPASDGVMERLCGVFRALPPEDVDDLVSLGNSELSAKVLLAIGLVHDTAAKLASNGNRSQTTNCGKKRKLEVANMETRGKLYYSIL